MAPIDNITIYGTNEPVSSDLRIEGYPIAEIAKAADEGGLQPQLSYYDLLNFFSLTSDQYTLDHHARFLTELLSSTLEDRRNYFFRDSLSASVRNRTFLEIGDLALPTLIKLFSDGFPLSMVGFQLALGNLAEKHNREATHNDPYLLGTYIHDAAGVDTFNSDSLLSQSCLEENELERFVKTVRNDPIKKRSADISRIFKNRGCGDIETEIDRNCLCKTISSVYSEHQEGSTSFLDYGGVWSGKVGVPRNTTSYFERTLDTAKVMLEQRALFPDRIERILDVGPGLEEVNRDLGLSVPPQSYEPFVLLDLAQASHPLSVWNETSIDLLDINPQVLEHYETAIRLAEEESHTYTIAASAIVDCETSIAGKMPFVTHLPTRHGEMESEMSFLERLNPFDRCFPKKMKQLVHIAPEVMRQLKPREGDIVTDRIGEKESYDVIMMMNVIWYLDEREKLLAFDNISRLLQRGGILASDIEPHYIPAAIRPDGLYGHGLHIIFKEDYPFLWRKD